MDPNSSNDKNIISSSDSHTEPTTSPSKNLPSSLLSTLSNLLSPSSDHETPPSSPDGKEPASISTPSKDANSPSTPEEYTHARSHERHSQEFSDAGNARRFASQHHISLRYVPLWSNWMLWDGKRWSPDSCDDISNFARATIQSLRDEALTLPDEQNRRSTRLFDHADRSDLPKRLQSMLNLACHNPALISTPQSFDSDPLLFNVLNGTIDLRSNRLLPHNPLHFITHLAPVSYDPSACSPVWDKFLSDITNHDPDLQHFLQSAIGYTLTASIQEQVVFLLHGPGCNGKSVFLNAIRSVLGDYSAYSSCDLVTTRSRTATSSPIPASLLSKRLVIVPDIGLDRTFATHTIDQITGGEFLSPAKIASLSSPLYPMYHFKLWMATNHLPSIHDYSAGAWRRIRLIHFPVSFLGREDKHLATKLQSCTSAILNWAIQGCLTWQHEGLSLPPCVEQATVSYQDEQDKLARFLRSCCLFAPNQSVKASDLYQAYRYWCREIGDPKPLDNKSFGLQICAHGYLREHKKTGNVYLGFSLISPPASLPSPYQSYQEAQLKLTLLDLLDDFEMRVKGGEG